ncbi:hypothetical protein DKX38_026639 [Salix brachista]|uniref:Retrovirus-related Pol polyprotein from transposon TNT 1-94-like beta-barrel domain-containing protein n=1 Tax=Salix brachista TaxID=2182728 RepID=A0A5N5JA73_9ROSI|nr:hypothetical protein DKX38_026639 [Salix brachista]
MREEVKTGGALFAKHHGGDKSKWKKKKGQDGNFSHSAAAHNSSKKGNFKGKYPPCHHCNKEGHPPFKCWRRPDAKCAKCNQLGHEAVICKGKNQQQQQESSAQIAEEEDEDQLFVATCFVSETSTESWLIDSGCTNHMTNDKKLFKSLMPTEITKVKIGNGDYISVEGKGTITITSSSGVKLISDVLYVPEINQNLLSVGQLIERGLKVVFEDGCCQVFDANREEILKVKMKGKSFSFTPIKEELLAFTTAASHTELWHKRLGHCHLQRGEAARQLLQLPPLPSVPNLPKPTLPPMPSIPTVPQPTLPTTQPSLPKPSLPPLPSLPTMPSLPKNSAELRLLINDETVDIEQEIHGAQRM